MKLELSREKVEYLKMVLSVEEEKLISRLDRRLDNEENIYYRLSVLREIYNILLEDVGEEHKESTNKKIGVEIPKEEGEINEICLHPEVRSMLDYLSSYTNSLCGKIDKAKEVMEGYGLTLMDFVDEDGVMEAITEGYEVEEIALEVVCRLFNCEENIVVSELQEEDSYLGNLYAGLLFDLLSFVEE